MAAYKKKIIALTAVAVFSSCLVGEAVCDTEYSPGRLFSNDPNLSAGSADGVSSGELFFKMMFSVLLVIALGIAAIYASKKFLPKITNLPGKKVRIVETVGLGQRRAVHLLQIGNRQLLIGSAGESITKLADVTFDTAEGLPDLSAQETDDMRI